MHLLAGQQNGPVQHQILYEVDHHQAYCSQNQQRLILPYIAAEVDRSAHPHVVVHGDQPEEQGQEDLAEDEEEKGDGDEEVVDLGGEEEFLVGFVGDHSLLFKKSVLEF